MARRACTARQLRQTTTPAEERAWELLRIRRLSSLKFRRQYPIGSWVVDLFCFRFRLAVELDGSIHAQPTQAKKDRTKDAELRRLGVRVLRLPNGIVFEDPDTFLKKVLEALPSPGASRHPLPEERE